MAAITEIAPDVYRISVYAPAFDLQFNQFLVRDDAPLIFHAGLKSMFPLLYDAVRTLVDPSRIRYVSFSHFESDECGALNEWLGRAPAAEAVCGTVGALVSLNDFALRPVLEAAPDRAIETGRYRFRYVPTPHVPHGWDAGVLFEETGRTLFCSDLFHQTGDVEPLAHTSLIERAREVLVSYESGPFAGYLPYTHHTGRILRGLADLEPRTLAVMHGSSYAGAGGPELRELARLFAEVLGPPRASGAA